jgi:hypothetical protein
MQEHPSTMERIVYSGLLAELSEKYSIEVKNRYYWCQYLRNNKPLQINFGAIQAK